MSLRQNSNFSLAIIICLLILFLSAPNLLDTVQMNANFMYSVKHTLINQEQNKTPLDCSLFSNARRQGQCFLSNQQLESFSDLINMMPQNSVAQQMAIVQLGNAYRHNGNEDKAINLWQEHKVFLYLSQWGLEAYTAEEFETAVLLFSAVRDIIKDTQISNPIQQKAAFDALSKLALLQKDEANYPEAIATYKTQLTVYPDLATIYQSTIYRQIGELYRLTKDYDQAQNWLEGAQKRAPGDSRPTYELGRVASDQQQWQSAITYFQQAITEQPPLSEPHYDLGNVYVQINELDAARLAFEKAIAMANNETRYRLALGHLCEEMDCINVSVEQYCHILQIKADHKEAQERLHILQASLSTETTRNLNLSCDLN